MRWILLDVALAVVALALLVLVGRSLWRRTRELGRAVSAATERVGAATAQLEAIVPGGADPAGPRPRA